MCNLFILLVRRLQISGVMTYGTNKLMVGSNVVNAGLKSSEYYIDTYLPATDGKIMYFDTQFY